MAAETAQLGLVTPTQGDLTGTWGNVVNNGITEYVNIAVAGTLTLTGDGAVTLANTTGNASVTNITATLAGAGTVTAQFAVVKISGTTVDKTVTGPSYSKTYVVDNAGGNVVTFKAAGQAGVSIIAGEKCTVYYNGTDYVKVASSTADGVSTISFGSTGLTPATATSGAVTVAGTLAIANGGTGTTSTTFVNAATNVTGTLPVANGGTNLSAGTSGGVLAYTASGTLASSAALAANNVVVGGGAGAVPSSTNLLAISAAVTSGNYIKAIGYADTVTALGNTGTAINLDLTSGNVFSATLNGSATITIRFPVATGASSFTLILTNDATGGRTVAFAGSGATFKYPGGAASLSRTTTANAIDVWFFFTPDGGTTYYGSIPMKNLTA
jgi:hypothetical protein